MNKKILLVHFFIKNRPGPRNLLLIEKSMVNRKFKCVYFETDEFTSLLIRVAMGCNVVPQKRFWEMESFSFSPFPFFSRSICTMKIIGRQFPAMMMMMKLICKQLSPQQQQQLGSISQNILSAAFTHTDPKSGRKTVNSRSFLRFWNLQA